MIKLILLIVVIAISFGIVTYENDKIVVDTVKAKSAIEKSRDVINNNIEIK